VGGMTFAQNGFETSSKMWTESLFRERGVRAILRATSRRWTRGSSTTRNSTDRSTPWTSTSRCCYRRSRGRHEGVRQQRRGHHRRPLRTERLPSCRRGLRGQAFEEWTPEDWPKTYQCPRYANVFGSASPLRHPTPSPNRGRVRTVRLSRRRPRAPACPRASWGAPWRSRSPNEFVAAAKRRCGPPRCGHGCGVHCLGRYRTSKGQRCRDHDVPIIPDRKRFPGTGRDLTQTSGEIGLSGTGPNCSCTTYLSTRRRPASAGS